MLGLQSDLSTYCSPHVCQLVFSGVLKSSLSHFAWRYCHVQPSRRRTPQFVADITAVLLCTCELLFYACDSLSPLLDPCEADADICDAHNSCSCLLAALTVVGAPLESVYRVFRKGFNKKSSHFDKEGLKGNVSQWLAWIQPQLFPHRKIW